MRTFDSDGILLAYLDGALWTMKECAGSYPQEEFKEILEELWNKVDNHRKEQTDD